MNKSSHNFYTISDEIKDELLTGLFKEIDKRNSHFSSWSKWENLHGPFKVFVYNTSYFQIKNELQLHYKNESFTNKHELFDCLRFFPAVEVVFYEDTNAISVNFDQIIYSSDKCILFLQFQISDWFESSIKDLSVPERRYISFNAQFIHKSKLELKYVLSTLPKELVRKYLKNIN